MFLWMVWGPLALVFVLSLKLIRRASDGTAACGTNAGLYAELGVHLWNVKALGIIRLATSETRKDDELNEKVENWKKEHLWALRYHMHDAVQIGRSWTVFYSHRDSLNQQQTECIEDTLHKKCPRLLQKTSLFHRCDVESLVPWQSPSIIGTESWNKK